MSETAEDTQQDEDQMSGEEIDYDQATEELSILEIILSNNAVSWSININKMGFSAAGFVVSFLGSWAFLWTVYETIKMYAKIYSL